MLFSIDSYVLNKEKIGEIDYLIELLTPKGKVWAVAKGAQKSKKRFLNILEDSTFLKCHLRKTKKGNLPILEKADVIFISEKARRDLKVYAFFSYINEVISKISYPGLTSEYFYFIKNLLLEIEKRGFFIYDKIFFEQKLLFYLGYYPNWKNCIKCGKPFNRLAFLNFSEGAIFCVNCKGENGILIEPKLLKFFQNFFEIYKNFTNLKATDYGNIIDKKVLENAINMSEKIFLYLLSFEIKSLQVLKNFILLEEG